MKNLIKKIIPKKILLSYHYLLAVIATVFYSFPSKKMIVIGITGTKGKTSTANFIWSALQNSGIKTGILTTANVRIGDKEMINPFHMTMPGRFMVQKFLRQMLNEGCECAIVETTSQGLSQYRHIGISYDMAIFTNLTPEHIDSHKNFENYKKAKGVLFSYLTASKRKKIRNKEIPKTIIVNSDDENSEYFLSFNADKKITFSENNESDYKAENILENDNGVSFSLSNLEYNLKTLGKFNVLNSLPAIAVGDLFGVDRNKIKDSIENLSFIPGRMEEIKEGQDFKVIVDYAHEKQSMTKVLEAGKFLKKNNGKIIVILGAEGGGRDRAKGKEMGKVAGKLADTVVVSNTDPYDDDPLIIAGEIADSAKTEGKILDKNLFIVLDRREGIRKALSLATSDDVVLITGMGAQQTMIMKGKELPWDDRKVVREELGKILKK